MESEAEPDAARLAALLPISPLSMGVLLSAVLIAALLGLHATLGYPIWVGGAFAERLLSSLLD